MNRDAWTKAVWTAQLAKQLTPYAYLVARAMIRRASKAGVLWPSRVCLASDVGCSERTVMRATDTLKELGLLAWEQRRLRWNRRDTNRYVLALPDAPSCVPSRVQPSAARSRQIAEKKEESILESSSAKMSDGSLTPALAERLASLGRLMGCPTDQVMPWLPASMGGAAG